MRSWWVWGVMLVLTCVATTLAAPPGTEATLKGRLALHQEKHRKLREELDRELQQLEAWCEVRQLMEGVATLSQRRMLGARAGLHRASLPTIMRPELADDLPKDERSWRQKLREREESYAKSLYLLSRNVLGIKAPGYALQLIQEVAERDPDHKQARRILGYVPANGEWLTPFAAKMKREGLVWHDRFGWLPQNSVARYEQGERQYEGRWITAEREAELRRDFSRAWEVRTDHYIVRTNHSLERGVQLAQSLEEFYESFRQIFAGFFNTPEQLSRMFETGPAVGKVSSRQHVVHYYQSRAEYLKRLKNQIANIEITNGLYLPQQRTTHFFAQEEVDDTGTLYHEATHQLFFEAHSGERSVGENAHFWVLEGIACYMETFRHDAAGYALGDPAYIRFANSRQNIVDDGYYIPLGEFAAMGMKEFQTHPRIVENYAQAAGLTQFFMQAAEGAYREALVTHLTQLYSPVASVRDRVASMAELTGIENSRLDREYQAFLKENDAKPMAEDAGASAR